MNATQTTGENEMKYNATKIKESMDYMAYSISYGSTPMNPELQLTPAGTLVIASGIYPIGYNRLIAVSGELDEILVALGMDIDDDGNAQYVGRPEDTIYTLEQWLA
jgi:hypothetical protein